MKHREFYECYNCEGRGVIFPLLEKGICTRCWGTGKLDWIENIVGKEKPESVIFAEAMAKFNENLAKKIDAEIMEMYLSTAKISKHFKSVYGGMDDN